MNCRRLLFLCLLLSCSFLEFRALYAFSDAGPIKKKLISTGWDTPNASQFHRDLTEMERLPFDGAVVRLDGCDANGKKTSSREAFTNAHWVEGIFNDSLADLKACRSNKLTDNFIILTGNPGDVDWFDDAGWKEIVEHWRILSRIAREGGMKGLVFDAEPYTKPFQQFRYSDQPQRPQHTYDDYRAKARERGREVMTAVATEFPNITILTYRLFSDCVFALEAGDNPQAELLDHTFGLLIPFADGWFDVIPPTITVVDGNEDAYSYNDENSFNRAYLRLKSSAQAFISPENRAKYRAQFQVGHGVYLDAYANPEGSPWYIDGKGETRAKRLEINVSNALKASDEYVWVNGEKGRWWPPKDTSGKPFPPWPEALPGSDQALLNAKDLTEAVRRKLAEILAKGNVDNKILNGSFVNSVSGQPVSWRSWQQEKDSNGQFSFDAETGSAAKGSAKLTGVKYGCFVQSVTAESGHRFLVATKVRRVGNGAPWLRVGWQTADNKWTARSYDVRLLPLSGASADGWRDIVGEVKVPDGAGKLVVLPGISSQFSSDDQVWFDDVIIVESP